MCLNNQLKLYKFIIIWSHLSNEATNVAMNMQRSLSFFSRVLQRKSFIVNQVNQQSKTQLNVFLQHNGFSQYCPTLTKLRIPMCTSDGFEFRFFDSSFILQLQPCPSGLSSSLMPMKDGQMGLLMKSVVATQDSKYATSNKHANHQT